jgi:SAM-dependent methyltransferase
MVRSFADRGFDDERLVAQGKLFDPMTRRVLCEAGLAPGMRVLDLGSGAGNVSRIAADMVGPDGAVVGIEKDPDAVALARQRTDAANIEYRQGDVQTLDGVETGFDAVIGRLVLMYLWDPVEALRQAAARVKPGGLICMHEADLAYIWTVPQTPLWEQARTWFLALLVEDGLQPRMGPSLHTTFRSAGLPGPRLLLEGGAEGGSNGLTSAWATIVAHAVPMMEKRAAAEGAEAAPETLAERLVKEIREYEACLIFPMFTGAWTTLPTSDGS